MDRSDAARERLVPGEGSEGSGGAAALVRRAVPLVENDASYYALPDPKQDRARPILVDDESILEMERQLFAERGHRVVLARDGDEALRAIGGELPAVIVLDMQMPGLDGPTFARELRQSLRHVPLVVVTAAPDPEHEADRCDAEAYLQKPFDADELVETVERFAA
ncbi:MAG: response regulator [Chloroflexi bacterium]|nr:response regulator [Chloroflexota bacterium]